jgi:hypothetical protein
MDIIGNEIVASVFGKTIAFVEDDEEEARSSKKSYNSFRPA